MASKVPLSHILAVVGDVDKWALPAYREKLIYTDLVVPSSKEYLQTIYESMVDMKSFGLMYQ